jgi:hypothetical protein
MGRWLIFFTAGTTARSKGVPREVREGPDAALAQDHLIIALREDVLGRHQELLERRRHPALQHDRLPRLACALQQREVLHVARSDLDRIRIALDQIEALEVHGLGDHRQAGLLPSRRQHAKPFLSEPLKGIGAGPRLVGAAAEQVCARLPDGACHGEGLLQRLDGTGSRNHGQLVAPDLDATDLDDGILRLDLA